MKIEARAILGYPVLVFFRVRTKLLSRWRSRLLSAACGLALLGTQHAAHAQAENQAAARALFEEARDLARAGKYAAACPKFEAANRLYTSPGALLNLGDCYEHLGRTASAWTQFGEAATVSERAGRGETAEEARKRQRNLERKLMRLTVQVSKPVAGLVVERDGLPLADAAWGVSLPVDPGQHRLEAKAPGHAPWSTTVELKEPGRTVVVEVPALDVELTAHEPETPSEGLMEPAPPNPERDTAPARTHTWQWVLIGGGAAVGIGGVVLMLVQSSRAGTARDRNDPEMYDSTKTPWAIGLTGAILGAAGATAGAVWLLSEQPGEQARLEASPWLSARAGGMTLRGTW